MLLEQSFELCQDFDLCASQAKLFLHQCKAIHFAGQSEAFHFSLQTLIHSDQSVGLNLPRLIQGEGFTGVAGGGAGVVGHKSISAGFGWCFSRIFWESALPSNRWHGFNLAQPEHRSIANRKKDSFKYPLTTVRWGITLGAWGGYGFLPVRTKAQRAVPPPAFSVQRKLTLVNAFLLMHQM